MSWIFCIWSLAHPSVFNVLNMWVCGPSLCNGIHQERCQFLLGEPFVIKLPKSLYIKNSYVPMPTRKAIGLVNSSTRRKWLILPNLLLVLSSRAPKKKERCRCSDSGPRRLLPSLVQCDDGHLHARPSRPSTIHRRDIWGTLIYFQSSYWNFLFCQINGFFISERTERIGLDAEGRIERLGQCYSWMAFGYY